MVEKIVFFEYDTTPTDENEIVVAFKVKGIGDCEMKIPEEALRDMLSWIDLESLCLNCRNKKRNPSLDVCGECYHKQICGRK